MGNVTVFPISMSFFILRKLLLMALKYFSEVYTANLQLTVSSKMLAAPTGPPVGLNAEPDGPRSILFTWQPPEPHLQNGIIINYTISCIPSPLSPLTPVAEAGSVTVSGFSPFTSYNCSVRATNSAGNGPPAYVSSTTEDDGNKPWKLCIGVKLIAYFYTLQLLSSK